MVWAKVLECRYHLCTISVASASRQLLCPARTACVCGRVRSWRFMRRQQHPFSYQRPWSCLGARLQVGQVLQVLRGAAPAHVGALGQHACPRARRVQQHCAPAQHCQQAVLASNLHSVAAVARGNHKLWPCPTEAVRLPQAGAMRPRRPGRTWSSLAAFSTLPG